MSINAPPHVTANVLQGLAQGSVPIPDDAVIRPIDIYNAGNRYAWSGAVGSQTLFVDNHTAFDLMLAISWQASNRLHYLICRSGRQVTISTGAAVMAGITISLTAQTGSIYPLPGAGSGSGLLAGTLESADQFLFISSLSLPLSVSTQDPGDYITAPTFTGTLTQSPAVSGTSYAVMGLAQTVSTILSGTIQIGVDASGAAASVPLIRCDLTLIGDALGGVRLFLGHAILAPATAGAVATVTIPAMEVPPPFNAPPPSPEVQWVVAITPTYGTTGLNLWAAGLMEVLP